MPVALDPAPAQTVAVALDLHVDEEGDRGYQNDGDDRIRNMFARYRNHRDAVVDIGSCFIIVLP
jgi:hypothetical protein